jgi:hypothetical protein
VTLNIYASNLDVKSCGVCRESSYCCVECQTEDWKIHKIWCGNRLPVKLLSSKEINRIYDKLSKQCTNLEAEGKRSECLPLMEMLLRLLERQLATEVPGEHEKTVP